jgi:hypothetical protein
LCRLPKLVNKFEQETVSISNNADESPRPPAGLTGGNWDADSGQWAGDDQTLTGMKGEVMYRLSSRLSVEELIRLAESIPEFIIDKIPSSHRESGGDFVSNFLDVRVIFSP